MIFAVSLSALGYQLSVKVCAHKAIVKFMEWGLNTWAVANYILIISSTKRYNNVHFQYV